MFRLLSEVRSPVNRGAKVRLTQLQRSLIKAAISDIFGENVKGWVYGSRADDKKFGGDIDLYLEGDVSDNVFMAKIKLKLMLEDIFGEQKIDIIYHNRNLPLHPIHKIAKDEGQLL